jgi:hypothetical protein
MSEDLITSLTLDELRALLQQSGYRVETATDPVAGVPYLRSATGGLAFDIRPGNRAAGDAEGRFADMAFVCVLQLDNEPPAQIVDGWNVARRFTRLQRGGSLLALCMDVSVIGGVTPAHVRAQIEIWDHSAQDLIAYLRDALRKRAEPRVTDQGAPTPVI